jgi:hypothetical protein
MKEEINITKASGRTAPFSEEKLRNSLQRVGASPDQVDSVIQEVTGKLYEGITTKKIYRLAFNLLKDSSRHIAAKYHLKQAIMELGPSGFPFEKYIGEILAAQGYLTQVGVIVQGKCVNHEIDVIAQREQLKIMIECKYHNLHGTFCDVKIPLYIHARFKDVESVWIQSATESNKQFQGWLVTNTRFSKDAIQYGTCAGLKLIGWDYPLKDSLKDQIDRLALYPITCLTSLTKSEKQWLLDRKIVLCKEIYDKPKLLAPLEIKSTRMDVISQEIHQLCKNLIATKKVTSL